MHEVLGSILQYKRQGKFPVAHSFRGPSPQLIDPVALGHMVKQNNMAGTSGRAKPLTSSEKEKKGRGRS
jgi:hypothetical protein